MTIDKKTIDFYNRGAKKYASWSASIERLKLLQNFILDIPEEGKILDFGCGTGWATSYFCSKSYFVTAMDASKGMLDEIPKDDNIDIVCGDFLSLSQKNFFDAVWACFSLQHAPRNEIRTILSLINRSLKLNGKLYIGIHEGEKTIRDSLGRYYCYYMENEIKDLLLKEGFNVHKLSKHESIGYDGSSINIMNIDIKKIN